MKNPYDLAYKSASELNRLLITKAISAVELLEATISRIEIQDKKINAVPVRDFERAYIEAKVADARIAKGEQLPLLGVPITVKESFNITGLPTTWGDALYKEWYPQEDALVIKRFKSAGAIIIGKTNVPLMLRDWQTYNDIYGTTNNPWNFDLTPGGSSGGSAAALAAGFVSLELGTDIAGSVRAPAHYCGVFGHKPTDNIIPQRGASPPGKMPSTMHIDLVTTGPLARTANDLELALNILARADEMLEGKGYKLCLPPARKKDLKDYRILTIDKHPLFPTSNVISNAVNLTAQRLAKKGCVVSEYNNTMPDLIKITQNYALFLSGFIGARVSTEEYEKALIAAAKLHPEDTDLNAYRLRAYLYSNSDWLAASVERDQLRQQWCKLFNNFDVILCPVMPTPAFPHDHSDIMERQIAIDGVLHLYRNQFIWASIATLFGLPATVAPIGQTETGLPIGVQIIGDSFEDLTTIKFASLIEQEFGGFSIPSNIA